MDVHLFYTSLMFDLTMFNSNLILHTQGFFNETLSLVSKMLYKCSTIVIEHKYVYVFKLKLNLERMEIRTSDNLGMNERLLRNDQQKDMNL